MSDQLFCQIRCLSIKLFDGEARGSGDMEIHEILVRWGTMHHFLNYITPTVSGIRLSSKHIAI